MTKQLLAALLVSASLLTACGGAASGSQAENAGKAMAETACLLFDENVDFETIAAQSEEIVQNYGFESSTSIDDYIMEVAGTEEQNAIVVAAREHLEATCGEDIEASGLSAAELSEAMVLE
jgi:predicted small secreted protein